MLVVSSRGRLPSRRNRVARTVGRRSKVKCEDQLFFADRGVSFNNCSKSNSRTERTPTPKIGDTKRRGERGKPCAETATAAKAEHPGLCGRPK